MRKISLILFMVLLLTSFAIPVNAENLNIRYLDDGYYIVSEITDTTVSRATNTKTGQKTSKLYNSDGDLLVTFVLHGTFTYNGSTSTCTNSTVSTTVYNSKWKVTSAVASKSGNKAIGDFTVKRYLLGIPVQTEEVTLTLKCSASGVLS